MHGAKKQQSLGADASNKHKFIFRQNPAESV